MNGGRRRWMGAAGAGLLATVCYLNTLTNDFAYDDDQIIARNPAVVAPGRFSEAWTRDYWYSVHDRTDRPDLLYRPLTVTTFHLNHLADDLRPRAIASKSPG